MLLDFLKIIKRRSVYTLKPRRSIIKANQNGLYILYAFKF